MHFGSCLRLAADGPSHGSRSSAARVRVGQPAVVPPVLRRRPWSPAASDDPTLSARESDGRGGRARTVTVTVPMPETLCCVRRRCRQELRHSTVGPASAAPGHGPPALQVCPGRRRQSPAPAVQIDDENLRIINCGIMENEEGI